MRLLALDTIKNQPTPFFNRYQSGSGVGNSNSIAVRRAKDKRATPLNGGCPLYCTPSSFVSQFDYSIMPVAWQSIGGTALTSDLAVGAFNQRRTFVSNTGIQTVKWTLSSNNVLLISGATPAISRYYVFITCNDESASAGVLSMFDPVDGHFVRSLYLPHENEYFTGESSPTLDPTRPVVYLTTNQGRVYAINYETETTVWARQYGSGEEIAACPVISPDGLYLYFGTMAGIMHCVDSSTGIERTFWPYNCNTAVISPGVNHQIRTACALDRTGTILYFTSHSSAVTYNGYLFALDAATGAPYWHLVNNSVSNGIGNVPYRLTTERIQNQPVISLSETRIYCLYNNTTGSTFTTLLALDSNTGATAWSTNISNLVSTGTLAISPVGGSIYLVGNFISSVAQTLGRSFACIVCIQPATGSVSWQYIFGSLGNALSPSSSIDNGYSVGAGSPVVDSNGNIIVGVEIGGVAYVYKFNSSGDVMNSHSFQYNDSIVVCGPAVDYDGGVVVGIHRTDLNKSVLVKVI